MKREERLPTGDVFETKLHRFHVGDAAIETTTVSALAGGAVHEVVDERLPCDTTGRSVKPDGACCAFCGTAMSASVVATSTCQAPGCFCVACEKHRFLNSDGEVRCGKHDPWRFLLDLLWGCEDGGRTEPARDPR